MSEKTGRKAVTTAGTPVQLGSGPVSGHLLLTPTKANTGKIEIGSSSAGAASGYELSVGDTLVLVVDNLEDVWVDATVNGEGVDWCISNWVYLQDG